MDRHGRAVPTALFRVKLDKITQCGEFVCRLPCVKGVSTEGGRGIVLCNFI